MSRPSRFVLGLAAAGWGSAAVLYVAAEALAASAFSPAYSYAENYISDLGVPACGTIFDGRPVCSPLHALMNGDFVLQGLLFLVAGLAAAATLRSRARFPLAACAVLNALGIGLVGLVPETSRASGLHGLGALLAIVFGNATAFASAFAFRELRLTAWHRVASLALPLVAATALAMLVLARARGATVLVPDGALERASVYTITAWELATAGCLAWRLRATTAPMLREAGLSGKFGWGADRPEERP